MQDQTKKHLKGQSLPEYATILALVTLFCITAVTFLGENIQDFILDFSNQVQGVSTSPHR